MGFFIGCLKQINKSACYSGLNYEAAESWNVEKKNSRKAPNNLLFLPRSVGCVLFVYDGELPAVW